MTVQLLWFGLARFGLVWFGIGYFDMKLYTIPSYHITYYGIPNYNHNKKDQTIPTHTKPYLESIGRISEVKVTKQKKN